MFPLFEFWGPATDLKLVSEWIADATVLGT